MNNPYTTDDLIKHLNHYWEKANGADYGHEHEIMRCAADRLEQLGIALARIANRTRGSELARIANEALDGEKPTQPTEIINDRK